MLASHAPGIIIFAAKIAPGINYLRRKNSTWNQIWLQACIIHTVKFKVSGRQVLHGGLQNLRQVARFLI